MSLNTLNYGNCNKVIRDGCPIEYVLSVLGKKWNGVIINYLFEAPSFYNELHRSISGISRKILTNQLRELQAENIVSRIETNDNPKKVQYALTLKGEQLYYLLKTMANLFQS
ncbi:helix-turn-helix transcriptional regulator [Staphylococcus capitis]|uniref:winged helix-turn-helix transcriptional regulator n=1 Tax=Staphylococcus capitis TaxID=29388 RepID=UPI0020413291|nr:helix-turn-helix domain-containing protein [Staphylococcus capitis]MCM3283319.1 helix-turn-helix transcriptional regulator [Staphylococcus capitis]